MSEQLLYTLCRSGVGVVAGYNVYSTSAGLSASDRTEIEARYSMYVAPESIPVSGADDPNIGRMPESLGFSRLGSGSECITHQVYTGADYDNPARMGNYISHSVTDACFGFYPIEALGFGGFCRDMRYGEMDCSVAPPVLPPIDLVCPDMLGRVSSFVASHDKRLLRELAYRTLDAMDDRLKKVFVAEKYDNADWIAAVTMLLPRDLAKQIPFITYTGNPDRCFHKLAGIFDRDDLPPSVSIFAVSLDGLKESERDELFDAYVDSAYSEGSDRERFFAFLSRVGWKGVGKGIIDAYHMFSVCEKGVVPPEGARRRALDALKATIGSATDEDVKSVYAAIKDVMDDDAAGFFESVAIPAMKDRQAADRMLAEVSAYRLAPSRAISDGPSVAESFGRYRDSVRRCLGLKAFDLLDYPAGRYYCMREWAESKDPGAAEALAGYEAFDGLFLDALCSDGKACMAAIGSGSPVSEAARAGLKEGISSRAGTLPRDLVVQAFGLGLKEDAAFAERLSAGSEGRSDRMQLEESFVDAALEAGDSDLATSLANRHVDFLMGGEPVQAVRFVAKRASGLGGGCVAYLAARISGKIDFSSFVPLPAAKEALSAFPDMEGAASSADVARLRLLCDADSICRSGTARGPVDVSALEPEEVKRLVSLCLGPSLPQKHADRWISDRMEYFPACPDLAAERVSALLARTMSSGLDTGAVAAFIGSSKSIGASDESVYGKLKLDSKQRGKVRKLLDESLLEGFDAAFPEEEEPKKGLFSKGKQEDAEEPKKGLFSKGKEEDQPKKGLLKGLFKR